MTQQNMNDEFIIMVSTRIIVSVNQNDFIIPCCWFDLKYHEGVPYLLLEDISKQIIIRYGEDIIIDVWTELGLSGYIYRYCKLDYGGWIEHGQTRGYA